jgi:hypothetical protein
VDEQALARDQDRGAGQERPDPYDAQHSFTLRAPRSRIAQPTGASQDAPEHL